MSATQTFGHLDGTPVEKVTLINRLGLSAEIITYGARLVRLMVPDRDGRLDDVVLGFDTLDGYLDADVYFGATCGRYSNRIARGELTLDGVTHALDLNDGRNHLHGGAAGFHSKIWVIGDQSENRVRLVAQSEDGEMGYPGQCQLSCVYELTDDNRLLITMEAETTAPTVINMVNHSYFNLAGQGSGDVLGHELRVSANFYVPVDATLIASGEILSVRGTPFDFTSLKAIGRDIEALRSYPGYDHCFCLDSDAPMHPCAELRDPDSGRRMSLSTSEPGVQVYTGGHLNDRMPGKDGKRMCRFAGIALETEKFPGSPGFAHFPSARVEPGKGYRHTMEYRFSTDDE